MVLVLKEIGSFNVIVLTERNQMLYAARAVRIWE